MVINKDLFPVKGHYFFFMAAMGPILPQLSVYGKELGVSPVVMGTVTGILPFMFLLAKPGFGIIVDMYRDYRKAIFIALILTMSFSYAFLYFIPANFTSTRQFAKECHEMDTCNVSDFQEELKCLNAKRYTCQIICDTEKTVLKTLRAIVYNDDLKSETLIENVTTLNRVCFIEDSNNNSTNTSFFMCENSCDLNCYEDVNLNEVDCLYGTTTFWGFIILMSIGTIAFNVCNSISDAICFDVLGKGGEMGYGKQRVWGTIGFGIFALLSGYIIDWIMPGTNKTYTPAFIIMLICTAFDMIFCIKLKLPIIPAPSNIIHELKSLFKYRHIMIFVIFSICAGIMDGFIIYFLFWYLEDLAIVTQTSSIKLLEGLTVAAETLGGEVIFFSISGKILERIGYGHSFSICFICYALRLGLISIIPSPWWILPIEFIFQGPTYAMTYTTIVAYASAISPPGTSATMQGIAAGMDDGLGYAMGSFFGGLLYKYVGGKAAFQIFSVLGLLCGIVHFILYRAILQHKIPKAGKFENGYKSPTDALQMTYDDIMLENSERLEDKS